MTSRRRWLFTIAVALGLFAAACRDATAPLPDRDVIGLEANYVTAGFTPCILQQAPTAPPLEAYQVSFWVRHDREANVAVNYTSGEPYLRFRIPKFGLKWTPDGARVQGSDSVLITMTLDPVYLTVRFEPSGLTFSDVFPAQLVISYANANPDLNGDGVVNVTDWLLKLRLGMWGQSGRTRFRVGSTNNTSQQSVTGYLYHFSEYYVAW